MLCAAVYTGGRIQEVASAGAVLRGLWWSVITSVMRDFVVEACRQRLPRGKIKDRRRGRVVCSATQQRQERPRKMGKSARREGGSGDDNDDVCWKRC